MQIQVNVDKHVANRESLIPRVESAVAEGLVRFAEKLTRVEVHLRDESAGRSTGSDQRCMLEARPAGQDPVAVVNLAVSMDEAVSGAVAKLRSVLTSEFGRIHDRRTEAVTIDESLPEL